MHTPSDRPLYRLILLVLLFLVALSPVVSNAQEEAPPSATSSAPMPTGDGNATSNAEAVRFDEAGSSSDLTTSPTSSAVADEAAALGSADPAVDPWAENLPSGTPVPLNGASTEDEPVTATGVQGVVTLDVSVPDTVRPGDLLVYTYSYQNTGTSTASNVVLDAVWANYSATATTNTGIWQYCDPSPCNVLSGSVQGPAVTKTSDITSGVRFQIGDLAAGQSGQFQIRLRSNKAVYPQTNKTITRPAGSGKLFLNGSSTPTSEDTANTMVIGPVLTLNKTVVDPNLKIYPGETAEFTIKVGNATGTGDSVGGQIRADARPATNIVLVDTFPGGGEFVSATGNPTVNTTAKTVTWTIAGPLNPGQSIEVRVVFRKGDNNISCERLNNSAYNVTSDEMPLRDTTNRYTVSGPAASVPIVTPLVIKSIVSNPTSVPYGSEATITIVVQNFWNQPLNGVQLHYDIQSNTFYVPNSATPGPSAAPTGADSGGRVTWTFNIGAGSKTAATESTFSLRVRGGYTTTIQSGTGRAQVIAPGGVPAACLKTRDGRVNLTPRLKLTKATDADVSTKLGNTYIVERNEEFSYNITVSNVGTTDATGVQILDELPDETAANFSYVVGSGTLDGAPRQPDSIVNGFRGSLTWNNLTIPAGGTIVLRYRLVVDGRDYYSYCNFATVNSGVESITVVNQRLICVKINPQINVTKSVDRTNANPGEEVRFTLTLTNNEAVPYQVGLYDRLGSFEFVRQESGYATPQQPSSTTLQWPLTTVGAGQQVTAVIVARVPNVCVTRSYVNEALFTNNTDLIQPVPSVKVSVQVNCGSIEYSKTSDRASASLQDRLVYTLQVSNKGTTTGTNLSVIDLLPQGFTYVGLEATSDLKTEPSRQTTPQGQPRLTWTIPSLAPNATTRIKFIARSGDVVGVFDNLMTVTPGGKCVGSCKSGDDGVQYSYRSVTIQPLITMEPVISPTACALPGDKPVYRLSIVNTNTHDYASTNVTVTLPFGLNFVRAIGATPTPAVNISPLGVSTVKWSDLRIPAKPSGAFASQLVLEVELQVGQVFGDLSTVVQTTSPDGLIPRKDGVLDPAVQVCPSSPVVAKEASQHLVRVGGELMYQLLIANPNSSPLTATLTDQLPDELSFVANVQGQATVNGNLLTWSNLTVPAAVNGKAGTVVLQFKVRVVGAAEGARLSNTVAVASSSVPLDTSYDDVTVVVARSIFLPIVAR